MPSAYYSCDTCHKRYATHRKLFETLYELQKANPEDCPACGGRRGLRLDLDFQLGCGDGEFKVVSAFLPDKLDSWLGEEEEEVTLYPFLVVLERTGDGKQFCWMPYWHVTGKEARYGQHAICLEQTQLESLIAQARENVPEKFLAFV
jgi:DNA-directed RNA polymerase subunit RPC12/RpoP